MNMRKSEEWPKRVEVLTNWCNRYDFLVKKLDGLSIFFIFNGIETAIVTQEDLDKAVQNNGDKLTIQFILYPAKISDCVRKDEPKIDTNSLLLELAKIEKGLRSSRQSKCSCSPFSETSHNIPNKYKFGRCIGTGSLGKVYTAVTPDGAEFAVKILNGYFKYLPQEADVNFLRRLRHKRIVQYLYIIEPVDRNEIHIFMEYMHSGSLKEYLNIYGALNNNLTKCYTKQIAEGLEYLHSNNIIHQDLKPQNLLLQNTHRKRIIKIADFGSSTFDLLREKRGQQGRTPMYTAPEVTSGRKIAGRRSDIWSFGVIIIEMISRYYPWHINENNPLIVSHILETQEPLILRQDDTCEELVQLALKMISPIRNRPYASDIVSHHILKDIQLREDTES